MEKSREAQGHGACKGEPNQELQESGCAEVPKQQRDQSVMPAPNLFIEHYKILCIYFHMKTIFLQIRYEVLSHLLCPWLQKTVTQLEI